MGECRDTGDQGVEDGAKFLQLIEKSRRDFLTILDSVPAMIWYRDPHGKILRTNQSAADFVGLEVRELVGKNYYELFSEDAAQSRQQDSEVITTGRPLRGLLREVKTPGSFVRWMMEDRFPMQDKGGRVVGVMAFVQDVTEKQLTEERLALVRKEIEMHNEQLRETAEKSRKLAEEAQRSNQVKSQILANSSHDLRTPMNAIIGFAELLMDSELNSEQREYIQTIHKAATGLLSLVNDILDFSKLEAGKLSIHKIACNLPEFIGEIRSMMEPGALQKGLTFNVRIDPRLPETFLTDPLRLRQCLVNLLGNAVKFTTNGAIILSVKSDCRQAQPCIRFDVEDAGIGISQDKQRQIFQSYVQAEDAIERLYGGTGLGLTITKRLTELLGGEVSVVSELGRGSVFSIVLPLTHPQSSDVSAFGAECGTSQPSKIVRETFNPETLITLLPELIGELPKTLDLAGTDRAAEISDMLGQVAAVSENQDYRLQIRELQEYFHSRPGTQEQTRRMILQLEQICREIYEYCRQKSV